MAHIQGDDRMSKTELNEKRLDHTTKITDEEKAAMRELAREVKAQRDGTADGERDVLEKIAAMPESDRVMAERIHALVKANAPELTSRTWYGMPAYAKNGKVIVFFKAADKFKTRYATIGFEEPAKLDDGAMWATSWALTSLDEADAKKVGALIKKAAS
jgi:uncharacterized protein YdhG (YjbR/CyaY superfamily)